MSNEELLYWLEQESVSDTKAFLPADTPLGALSATLVKSRLESLRRKHQRTIERLINQQTFALADFQAAFAERTDPALFPPEKKGLFEFVRGDRFLVEKQDEIMNLLAELQKPVEGNEAPKITQDTSNKQNIVNMSELFTKNIKLVYESELEELRNRQKRLFEEFQADYIEQKAILEKQLAKVAPPKEPETESPSAKRLRISPQTPHRESPPPPAHRVSSTSTPPPSASHRGSSVPMPSSSTGHRASTALAPSSSSHRPDNPSPLRKLPQHQPPSTIQAMANRSLSRDPRIQNTNRTTGGGRPPEIGSSSSRPPEVGSPLLKGIKRTKTFKKLTRPPEVASSTSESPKLSSKYTTGSLFDKGNIDIFDGQLVLIEKGTKFKSPLGSAKQFDDALHSPHVDCPVYVRIVNGDKYFYRKEDHVRIAPVSKLEPMIRNHLLRS